MRRLGEGAFGKVFLAQEKKSGQEAIVALKIMEKKDLLNYNMTGQLKREFEQ
jgi:hypothetical protein